MSRGQINLVHQEDEDTLLIRCHCTSMHFAQFYADRDEHEPFVYVTVTAQPASIRERIRGAFRSLFGRSWHESAEVCLDRSGGSALAAYLADTLPSEGFRPPEET